MAMLSLCGRVGGVDHVWPLDRDALPVGRAASNAIHIPDPTVSKEHAAIVRGEQGFLLRDLGSRNGTRVNGAAVTDAVTLRAGDEVTIGHLTFHVLVEAPGRGSAHLDPASHSVMIPARDILARASAAHDPLEVNGALAAAGRLLVATRSVEDTCEAFLSILATRVPASRSSILLRGPGGATDIIASRQEFEAEPVRPSRAILDAVLGEGISVLTVDAERDARFRNRASIVGSSVHSMLAVPLLDDHDVIGLLYADSSDPAVEYADRHLELVTVLANMAAVKVTNLRLLEAEQRRLRLAQELEAARDIQRGMLPARLDVPAEWDCVAHLDTCHEVGGDLYDVWGAPSGAIYLLVGDVSGKGMGAALLMASVITSARMLYDEEPEPGEVARRLNLVLHRSTDARHFVTAFIGRLEPRTGRLQYANAGHHPPLLVRDRVVRALPGSGFPLGVTARAVYATSVTDLPPGSLLAIYTDGIPEAQREAEFFGIERLEQRLRSSGTACSPMANSILDDLERFRGGGAHDDDLTLVLLGHAAAESRGSRGGTS